MRVLPEKQRLHARAWATQGAGRRVDKGGTTRGRCMRGGASAVQRLTEIIDLIFRAYLSFSPAAPVFPACSDRKKNSYAQSLGGRWRGAISLFPKRVLVSGRALEGRGRDDWGGRSAVSAMPRTKSDGAGKSVAPHLGTVRVRVFLSPPVFRTKSALFPTVTATPAAPSVRPLRFRTAGWGRTGPFLARVGLNTGRALSGVRCGIVFAASKAGAAHGTCLVRWPLAGGGGFIKPLPWRSEMLCCVSFRCLWGGGGSRGGTWR